jgi:exopolysaccharide biosynthesis polyprenyl glycosylphosphotransferase
MLELEAELRHTADTLPKLNIRVVSAPRRRPISNDASRTSYIEGLLDLITVCIGAVLARLTYVHFGLGRRIHYPEWQIFLYGIAIGCVFVLSMQRMRGYGPGSSLLGVRETERVLRATAETFFIFFAFSYVSGIFFSRWVLALDLVLLPTLVLAEKWAFVRTAQRLHRFGYEVRRVIVYGAGFTGRRVFSALSRSPRLGLTPVLIVDDDPSVAGKVLYELSYDHSRFQRVVSGPITRTLIEEANADGVIIAIPSLSREKFSCVIEQANAAGASVSFVPTHVLSPNNEIEYADVDGLLLATWHRPVTRLGYEFAKRAMDLVLSATILVLTSPLLLLLAVLVKIDSPGGVLFTQERAGKDGKLFKMYKFRSMCAAAPKYAYHPKSNGDPRITRVGRWLRKTSLDELPQLLNVLKGEMSLVGPRPEMPFITEQYTSRERQRLWVIPGITGIWQLSADRNFQIHESLQYDLYYLRHRNFFMDVAILLHTAVFAMRGI